jgi:hypothetical protein
MPVDQLKLRATAEAIKKKYDTDPQFKADFKKQPVTTLKKEGLTFDEVSAIETDGICIVTSCNGISII